MAMVHARPDDVASLMRAMTEHVERIANGKDPYRVQVMSHGALEDDLERVMQEAFLVGVVLYLRGQW